MVKGFKNYLVIIFLVLAGCNQKQSINAEDYMTRDRQQEVVNKLVRYATKLAPNSTLETRFDSAFNDYYNRVAADYQFMYLLPESDSSYYFLFSRPARSATPTFEGVAGKLSLNKQDSLIEYEETFRTWKMQYQDLQSRGKYLFNLMTKGEDLSPYYSNKAGDKYIEFPDGRFYFDKNKRRWIDKVMEETTFKSDAIPDSLAIN